MKTMFLRPIILLLLLSTLNTVKPAADTCDNKVVDHDEITSNTVQKIRFPLAFGVLPVGLFIAIISGCSPDSSSPYQIKGSVIFRQNIDSMEPYLAVLNTNGHLLEDVFPRLVANYRGESSPMAMMCLTLEQCFLFMGSTTVDGKAVMLLFDLLNPEQTKEKECVLEVGPSPWPVDDVLLTSDELSQYFSYHPSPQDGSFSQTFLRISTSTSDNPCPRNVTHRTVTRYLCLKDGPESSNKSSRVAFQREPCPPGRSFSFPSTSGFVNGDSIVLPCIGGIKFNVYQNISKRAFNDTAHDYPIEKRNIINFWFDWAPETPKTVTTTTTTTTSTTTTTPSTTEETTKKASTITRTLPSRATRRRSTVDSATAKSSASFMIIIGVVVIVVMVGLFLCYPLYFYLSYLFGPWVVVGGPDDTGGGAKLTAKGSALSSKSSAALPKGSKVVKDGGGGQGNLAAKSTQLSSSKASTAKP